MLAIAASILIGAVSLSILLALIAVSRSVADRLEQRREARYTSLTSFQQAMERIMNREQPR